ncbi:MAG: ATP-dependent sacrificial sulfur transferase LarE [Lachnospiraceae bacterium]|nr:ATP-dependent sacrificial sulfur transferase LarE [Lachnospiraceae bacterium]
MGISIALQKKYDNLKEIIKGYGSIAVAFSGGVDSTFLLKVAHDVLGANAIAITARSKSFPERERREAEDFCDKEGIVWYQVDSEELSIDGFAKNPANRCYLCKKELFTKLIALAQEKGIRVVAEGSNMDDNGDYRPGLMAVAELAVESPLRKAQLSKQEIRDLSKELGLPTWNKQSFACLASRFVYGEDITEKKLDMVDKAEQLLLDLGFHQVRVRIHGENLARIEVQEDEFDKIMQHREQIAEAFRRYGFLYVTMDLKGYRTGSMNATLEEK